MPWLFRVFSDSSHASNGPTGFAPAAAASRAGNVNAYRAPAFLEDMKAQLTLAISGRKTAPHNPFIFFTPSLLLALQFAHYRKGGFFNSILEQNIRITCFDSDRAQTPHGTPVKFECMEDMAQKYELEPIFDDGVRRTYLAEYVTMDCVVLDSTARTASLDDILHEGLYRLYPAIQEATNNTKFAPRVNRELQKLRKFCFNEENTIRPCDLARIDLAAKVASAFRSNDPGGERVAGHILAWTLSLTKRDHGGLQAISQWLHQNAKERPSDLMDQNASFEIDATTMPEVQQFHEILPLMSELAISNSVLSATTSISAKDNQKELFDWRDEQQVNNILYNEARKVKQAAKAAVVKEKNAIKKVKATKKKDDAAARKAKDKAKALKKKDADDEAKIKKKAKTARDKITAEKDKKRREREKKKRETEKAKKAKEKAKREKQKAANEKVQAAAQKKLALKNKTAGALGGDACPDEDSWMM